MGTITHLIALSSQTQKTNLNIMAKEKEVEVVEVKAKDSDAKVAFRKLIEVYKVSNPAKYAIKKEALEAKLNSL